LVADLVADLHELVESQVGNQVCDQVCDLGSVMEFDPKKECKHKPYSEILLGPHYGTVFHQHHTTNVCH